jgi:1-acyl-sn-glycerol-3-phosphate acyltransferase
LGGAARRSLGLVGTGLTAARATASGVLGDLVRSRAADPLEERDPEFIRATLPAYRGLNDLYFRPKVRGLENVRAEGPVLLVGNHSGGTLIADTFAFAYAFYEHFGAERPFFQLAHDLAVGIPGLSVLIRRYGTISASHGNAGRALATGAAVLVYPGGDYDSYRPSWQSGSVSFGGRTGFIQLALDHDVPVVPVVAIGGQETALFLTRGERAAKALRLDRVRLKVLPVQIAPPFGVTVLDLPGRIPLPSQVTVEVMPEIRLRERFGPEPDDREVYAQITGEMQEVLDRLAEERDLPVVGSVGPRSAQSLVAGGEEARSTAGRQSEHAEPWPAYDGMTVAEVVRRLRSESDEAARSVDRYERENNARKGVLSALERRRERARKPQRRARG